MAAPVRPKRTSCTHERQSRVHRPSRVRLHHGGEDVPREVVVEHRAGVEDVVEREPLSAHGGDEWYVPVAIPRRIGARHREAERDAEPGRERHTSEDLRRERERRSERPVAAQAAVKHGSSDARPQDAHGDRRDVESHGAGEEQDAEQVDREAGRHVQPVRPQGAGAAGARCRDHCVRQEKDENRKRSWRASALALYAPTTPRTWMYAHVHRGWRCSASRSTASTAARTTELSAARCDPSEGWKTSRWMGMAWWRSTETTRATEATSPGQERDRRT